MEQKARHTIAKFQMLPKGLEDRTNIVVGVSGGADSMALLHFLYTLQEEYGWTLQVVHVHHGLRGVEADEDCAFVEEVCKKWGIPCHVFHFDVKGEGKRRGLGTEETGRLLRYESFRKVAKGAPIAVAHHQGDQGETMLMRLCRGTGLLGLGGMRPVQGDVVRPLLFVTREEIENYCMEYQIAYCMDSTNDTDAYTRNRIRHQLMPLMEAIHPKAATHLAQTASYLAEDEDYLQMQAEVAYGNALIIGEGTSISFSHEKLQPLHPSMKKRVWRLAFSKLGLNQVITAAHLRDLEKVEGLESGKSVQLPQGFLVRREYGQMILERMGGEIAGFSYALHLDEEIFIKEGGFFIHLRVSQEKNIENESDCYTNVLDYDKIKNNLFCRTRKDGDFIAIAGGRKKLKDYFIDEKIPRQDRQRQPLLTCGGEVLWVIGGRRSFAYQVEAGTKQFLIVRIRRIAENEGTC